MIQSFLPSVTLPCVPYLPELTFLFFSNSEESLANILSVRAMAKETGELKDTMRKRVLREARFRQRVLKIAGLEP